tara:strand:+ start:1123 stop:1788 length:666 start_codon:yes stop_codon:yes gene_type:complete
MKKWFVALLTFMSFSASTATLNPEKGLSILYINGQESESSISSQDIPYGLVQVVLRTDKNIGRGNSAKVFTSDPYVVSFEVTGDEVKIKNPPTRSIQEAEKSFKSESPAWVILQEGIKTSYEQEKLPSKSTVFPYVAIDSLVAEYNTSKGIYFDNGLLVSAPVAKPVATIESSPKAVKEMAPNMKEVVISDTSSVEQLKAWYLKASKQERKEFRRWMIDQE